MLFVVSDSGATWHLKIFLTWPTAALLLDTLHRSYGHQTLQHVNITLYEGVDVLGLRK